MPEGPRSGARRWAELLEHRRGRCAEVDPEHLGFGKGIWHGAARLGRTRRPAKCCRS